MHWKNLKLNWSYAVSELLIVVVGILIALAIDQWNDNRLERTEEVEAISRILVDVRSDLQFLEFRFKAIASKEKSLLRIRETLAGSSPSDPRSFLKDIVIGADFGWNQGLAQQSTYDDLLGSGKLGIIGDPEIRFQIATYYRYYEDEHNRIDERETDYPSMSYRLVPRNIISDENLGVVLDREIDAALSDEQIAELAAEILESPIKNHVTAEINLARFIYGVTLSTQRRASALAETLEEYQAALQ